MTKLIGGQITKLIEMQQKRSAEKVTKLTGEQYQIDCGTAKRGAEKVTKLMGYHVTKFIVGQKSAEKVTKIDWGQVTKLIMGQPKKVPKR